MSKYEYIDSQRNDPTGMNPVVKMCLWLQVSTSGFYNWAKRPQSEAAARRQQLAERIRYFFEESGGTYGYRRIHADLTAEEPQCLADALKHAAATTLIEPGAVFHSDRGSVGCIPGVGEASRDAFIDG